MGWKEPKSNYTAESQVTPEIFNTLAENEKYLQEKKITTEQVQDAEVSITQASTRDNLGNIEAVKTVFGKIKKWFSDLKALAFKATVGTADIDNSAVTTDKIAALAVTSAKIGSGAVTATKIATDAVETSKIKNGAVTTDKITDGAVTDGKIASVSASKVTGLATVATSGNYNDLSNKPSIPSSVSVVDNLTSYSTTEALSANQGRVLNEKLRALGFSAGACSLTQTGILDVETTDTFTELAPDNSSITLQKSNYWIKSGRYVFLRLVLVGKSVSKGTQLNANTVFATIPSEIRPPSNLTVECDFQSTNTWSKNTSTSGTTTVNNIVYGKATITIGSNGNITSSEAVKYESSVSSGKTGASGKTLSGYVNIDFHWRTN